jgi:hypothetical protein
MTTNTERAYRAALAVQAYSNWETKTYQDEDSDTKLTDLLCDLRHWAADHDVDFDSASQSGENHYTEEVADEAGPERWEPDSHWDSHFIYGAGDWRHEVSENDTRQSYVDWVNSKLAGDK